MFFLGLPEFYSKKRAKSLVFWKTYCAIIVGTQALVSERSRKPIIFRLSPFVLRCGLPCLKKNR